MDFIIGGLAGAGATVITNPMDVVKTRLQLQGELRSRSEQTTRYRGIVHTLYVTAKTDGAFALQKGLAPAVIFSFTMNSVRLGSYHIAEARGLTKTKDGDAAISRTVFWAGASGVISGIAANPPSILKTRIQATSHPSIAVGRQYTYKGMFDGCLTIYRSDGVKGFYTGVTATCTRIAIASAVQLTTFSTMKGELSARGFHENSPVLLAFTASLFCSLLGVIVETPLDVVNTRLYNQGSAVNGDLLYKGILDCAKKIYRTEGLQGLYKGIGPSYLRIAPHTTLSLIIWDMLNNLLIHKNS